MTGTTSIKNTCIKFACSLLLLILSHTLSAQKLHSDNGDGTFTNPVIAADFPDPDVVRVGDTYYMVSTTMFVFPGVTVLKSHDLVNWEYCSHAIPRFDFSKCYNLDSCNRYGHGQWATSIKYHNGKFHLLFITLNEGGFMCTASKAEGPWEIQKLPKGFYDPGLFFDEDDKIYVAHGYSKINITELNPDFSPKTKDSLVYTGDIRKGLEGTHVYKINGYYYLYGTYGGLDGIQVALRSKNIYGPYEQKVVIRDTTPGVTFGVHQGALIQTQTGEWWTMLFVDSGPFGRFPSLQPVTWVDGWPMVGVNGKGVVTYKKPNTGKTYPVKTFPVSDEFSGKKLGMQWGWNHNPDSTKWSLTQRPGYLRLITGKAVAGLREARNTLTQRPFTYYADPISSTAITKMETSQMKDGDIAGLAVFQDPYAYIGVKQMNGRKYVVMVNNGQLIDSVAIAQSTIYLQTIASNSNQKALFQYSFDNKSFRPIGDALSMKFSLTLFTGNKFCLFNYATRQSGGYVDFDWFRMAPWQNNSIDSSQYYNEVATYVNPVLPGDHPDPTLLKVGNDFYHCGSSFHFTPYLPVYHSKDLVHWEVIGRVVPPAKASFVSDKPSAGIWQGAITYFYGSYWTYFSANGQWFCKASSPAGPWSEPVQVKTNSVTGNLGYDNSIFVDDDGKPYMVIKNGQKINRLQALGRDGQLTDTVINLDWINANLQYSWAEGPVMCKRNGYYYYFPAGDVSGGQYVLRASALTSDSTKWERLGNFFKPIIDPQASFRSPNHIAAPFQLADGTWWTIGQSYERVNNNDWSGLGRQTSLYQVIWEGDRPWGTAPVSTPLQRPHLPQSGLLWRSVHTDYFNNTMPDAWWHFLSKKMESRFLLTAKKGWLQLIPDTSRAHIVQKETDHYYAAITKVEINATDSQSKAGLYLTNGNQQVVVQLYSGYDNGKKIILSFDSTTQSISNQFGHTVWLKLERKEHELTGYCSGDGKTWTCLGNPVNVVKLDKVQPNYNSWVGTSIGLFAEGTRANFDQFVCKDGYAELPAIGYSNYFGIRKVKNEAGNAVTNNSIHGGWFMISGVELGIGNNTAKQVEVQALAKTGGKLEIWLDDLKNGQLIATLSVPRGGDAHTWKTISSKLKIVSGQHDVFVKFPTGIPGDINISSIRFK
ncbi:MULTISPECIES: family 43 glycosylhydrolase [Niastella]|uniref:Family 43 glycosylhydrolase n=1 Tax=Niastella soli TaxID=2821487 RepID=A0ABS3Z3Y9_9BACT|nr:family 43 glycosylhydrolase [Niastella soli]MBO9204447.1 family 43 glycosylhydrolase [Niastella soli]